MAGVASNRIVGSAIPMDVSVVDGSGNQVTAFGGVGGTSHGDDSTFTIGSASSVTPAAFLADQTTPDSVDEGDVGVARMTLARVALGTIWDAAGNERGANVDASNQLAVTGPVTNAGTFVVQEDGAALTALQLIDNPVFADSAGYTVGTSSTMVGGSVRDDVIVDATDTAADARSLRSNDQGALWTEGAHIDSTDDAIRDDDLDETAVAISANAGVCYGFIATNLDATPVFVHIYNVAAASVTVGTTVGELSICVPSQGDANGAAGVFTFPKPLYFDTAASMAATTTVGGNTGPGTNELFINVFYRDI